MASYLSVSHWNSDGHSPYAFTNSASASANSCIISSSYSSIALEIRVSPCFLVGEGVYPTALGYEMLTLYVQNVNL